MKRFGILFAAAALLLASVGCGTGTDKIIDSSAGEGEPVLIVGTVEDTQPPTTTPEQVFIGVEAETTPSPTPEATPEPTETPTPEPTDAPTQEPTATPDGTQIERMLTLAESLLDKPYLKSGRTPEEGFDPGGFIYYCLNQVGYKVGKTNSNGYSAKEDWAQIDSLDDVRAGDLLFFKTGDSESVNCGTIYLGDNEMIYPSFSEGKVIRTKSNSTYWQDAFVLARRVFG